MVGSPRISPHFRNRLPEVCGKSRNPRAHHPFRTKKPQVEALVLCRVLGMFDICRILSDLTSVVCSVKTGPLQNNGQKRRLRLRTKTPAEAKLLLPALACLLVTFMARERGSFWAFKPPSAPHPARCGRVRRRRRWPCPCRSTCSRPGDLRRPRRPPVPPAPRTACRGPRSWRR